MKTSYPEIKPYETKDGSLIRELLHPRHGQAKHQSLAEAIISVGMKTHLHRHHVSEEIYHITSGRGRMTLGERSFEVATGDSICISPGMAHRIENIDQIPLVILCCCAPPYSHEDTELL